MIKNHKTKQNINSEVNGNVNAAQTKGVLSPEGKIRTNLSATVDLRKNENLEHNSSMIKNHKTKQNINSEVNGNVNAAPKREKQPRTNLSATNALKKNEGVEHNSSKMKKQKTKEKTKRVYKRLGSDDVDAAKRLPIPKLEEVLFEKQFERDFDKFYEAQLAKVPDWICNQIGDCALHEAVSCSIDEAMEDGSFWRIVNRLK
jgi:hypothetical protein